jgi:formate dehydrogenase major subunit
MGSNMAENHPIAFRFVLEAKERNGATIIHVDPRFTRTSALADLYAPVRAGSDIAFLGGLINYILEKDLWFKEYALAYTNIATIIEDTFQGAETLDGFFSGWDEDKHIYDETSWQYRGQIVPSPMAEHYSRQGHPEPDKAEESLTSGPPPTDPTLQHPNCVYQIMRRHYARYTPEMVERVTGCPQATFLQVAEAITRNSGRERTGAWCYAVGWTHHTTGVQMIRACAIIQALLGNIGRPGGGVLALRGHASIQGSTDIPTLYHLLPGYLPQPSSTHPHGTLADYMRVESAPTGLWHNFPKYIVSLLRAWYGDAATEANEWGYGWVPKNHRRSFAVADDARHPRRHDQGAAVDGAEPVVGGHNTTMIREALPNLEWLVIRETFENETASYWYKSPEALRGEIRPEDNQTEMFMLPAALPGEKEGTFTNTHRLIQWHDQVVEPRADIRSDLWFTYHLGKRLKELYADSTDPKDLPIQNLTWEYPEHGRIAEPSAEAVLREINGYSWPGREQIASFADLKDDGSTACGCWSLQRRLPARRPQSRALAPGRRAGWSRHALELGVRLAREPATDLQPRRRRSRGQTVERAQALYVVECREGRVGLPRRARLRAAEGPDYVPDWSTRPHGMDALDGKSPFTFMADVKGQLFGGTGGCTTPAIRARAAQGAIQRLCRTRWRSPSSKGSSPRRPRARRRGPAGQLTFERARRRRPPSDAERARPRGRGER